MIPIETHKRLTLAQRDAILDRVFKEQGKDAVDDITFVINEMVKTSKTHQAFVERRDNYLSSL
jgi:hypothetical protein